MFFSSSVISIFVCPQYLFLKGIEIFVSHERNFLRVEFHRFLKMNNFSSEFFDVAQRCIKFGDEGEDKGSEFLRVLVRREKSEVWEISLPSGG